MQDKIVLSKFGHLLITEVRDLTIEKYEDITKGKIKSKDAIELHHKLANFDKEQQEMISLFIKNSIDETLHNLLFMIEQYDDINVMVDQKNIRDISDGLCGELYSEDGWINCYSRYK